jgi:hypothetical protein
VSQFLRRIVEITSHQAWSSIGRGGAMVANLGKEACIYSTHADAVTKVGGGHRHAGRARRLNGASNEA